MKFKNKKELIAFIVMNIAGAPITWIALGILINWWWALGSLTVMFISWMLWKRFGGHKDAKIRPRISFGK